MRRAGDPEVLWSSETPVDVNWGWNIAIPVEKCANVAIGDVIDVTVAAINSTEQEWSTQITLCDEDKKAITETYNIGKQTAPYVASFPVTGDMYKYIKENGFRLGGSNCTISKVELRKEVYKGSENSIWIGSATESNITIDLVHLVKAGIKKGDIIRVTLDATDWTQDVSGWVRLQYIKGESYTWTPFEESDLKTINRYDKTPVDFVLLTDAPATILKDVTNNHGLVVQGGSKTTITQVEVLTGHTVKVVDGITNGTVTVDKTDAAAGDEVTITTTPDASYELDAISVRGVSEDIAVTVKDGKFTMPADDVTVSATFKKSPVDVTIKAGDITGGDITAAIAANVAATGAPVKNLTINLAAGDYKVTEPVVAGGSIVVNGATGATIDASAVSAPLFQYGVPAASVSSARRAPATPV
ncbi:MAG: hypothetical protein IJ888_11555, partial [Prevotella sp.]|nr:hypothetical protein [Prevotella sp.]